MDGERYSGLPASAQSRPGQPTYHYLPANAETVHWGYFSKLAQAELEVDSGDYVTIEALTHHANDDAERMIKGDPGAESVFLDQGQERRRPPRRRSDGWQAARRGTGEGFGVHICTGPVAIRGAELGRHPRSPHPGRQAAAVRQSAYAASRSAAMPPPGGASITRTCSPSRSRARSSPSTKSTPAENATGPRPSTTSAGRRRPTRTAWSTRRSITRACPSTKTVEENHNVLKNVRIPLRPHFGVIGLAPKEADIVDSIPPSYFGGNMDNWRIGKGATMYYPVAVPGALFSVGDSHASQGDSELCGTAIECLDRHVPAHPAQAEYADGLARRPELSPAGNAGRMGRARLQLRQLPWRSWAPRRSRRSTTSPRSTSPCATRSARCAAS